VTFGEVKVLEIVAQEVPNSWEDCARVVDTMASSALIPKIEALSMIEVESLSRLCDVKIRGIHTTTSYRYR
jgi:hypothetical protein